jgi:4-hydroxy-tetrahydrodipicolinate reductase
VRLAVYGIRGRVGSVLGPALAAAGHVVADADPAGCEAAVDFTRPDAVEANVRACLDAGVPVVVGTSGWETGPVDEEARGA